MNKTNYTIRRIVAPLRCLLELEAFQHLYNPLSVRPSVCSFVRPSVPPETLAKTKELKGNEVVLSCSISIEIVVMVVVIIVVIISIALMLYPRGTS